MPALIRELTMTDEILYAQYTEFTVHPQNMRRFYREDDVRAMAESIRGQGILHPLIVLPANGDETHTIVDGNLRWHGCAALADDAPLLPYIVRDLSEQEQAEVMAASTMRRDPDPISEALHYQRMIAAGTSNMRIARLSGHSLGHISGRLKLLTLPQAVQDLVARGELLIGCALVLAEKLEDSDLQERAAQILAKNNAGIPTARRLCKRLLEMGGASVPPPRSGPKQASTLREGVRATCAACRVGGLERVTITWDELEETGKRVCASCETRDIAAVCQMCPLPQLLAMLRDREEIDVR